MHRDAGIKKSVAESKLHEHQNAREADARKGYRKPHGLPRQQQHRQGDGASRPQRSDGLQQSFQGPQGLKRAITLRPTNV